MLKRISLVWKHAHLTPAEFREIWLGEHTEQAKRLKGLRGYTIDFVTDGPEDAPSAIAMLFFDDRQALDAAFSDPDLAHALMRSRNEFASAVTVLLVDEHVVA